MNTLYGMLVRTVSNDSPYFRFFTLLPSQENIQSTVWDVLRPLSDDAAYRQYVADSLVRMIRSTELWSVLDQLDPQNTYANEFLGHQAASVNIRGLPSGIELTVYEPADAESAWLTWKYNVYANPPGGIATIDGYQAALSWTGSTSNIFTLNKLPMMFTGVAPASAFYFNLEVYRRGPALDLIGMLDKLDGMTISWVPELLDYKDTPIPSLRLSAYILNELAKSK